LTGLKFKIAHRRAGSEKWSATPKTQRKRMIAFLQSVIADLEKQNAREADVREDREKRAPSRRRDTRAARPSAKRATPRRRTARRAPARRQVSRATRVHRVRRSRV
jgi:hypothetical protein